MPALLRAPYRRVLKPARTVYVGRSWSQRGNVVRNNHFENIRPIERLAQKSCSQNAFYLDDQMSGYQFYGNTIVNASVGVLLGGGRRNSIVDNVFIDCDGDVHFDNRGQTWHLDYCRKNCTDTRNGYQPACFYHELQSLNYTAPPYSQRYPELESIYRDRPCTPVHNVVSNNRYCHRTNPDAKFLTANATQIEEWGSAASNNTASC